MIRIVDGKGPKIHPSVFVSEAAYIVGDVEIGEGSSVWPGAVIRGDYGKIIIGKNCSIQDNCVLHTDDYLELGDNVLMTHGAVIHALKNIGYRLILDKSNELRRQMEKVAEALKCEDVMEEV